MRLTCIGLVCFLFSSCNTSQVTTEDALKAYVLDVEHGLRKSITKNELVMEAIYRPRQLVIAQQLRNVSDLKEKQETIQRFDSLSYFMLKFSRKGQEIENAHASATGDMARIVNYLSYAIADDLYLINNNDTIPALDVAYTRTFGASDATSVMVVFNGKIEKRTGNIRLLLEDNVLGLGTVEHIFETNDIKNIPTINLN